MENKSFGVYVADNVTFFLPLLAASSWGHHSTVTPTTSTSSSRLIDHWSFSWCPFFCRKKYLQVPDVDEETENKEKKICDDILLGATAADTALS